MFVNILPKNLFDIIINVGPSDINVINEQINFTKKNIIGYRNIYLISYDPNLKIDNCITIDEKIFPFNIETVAKYHTKNYRNGWYLQQLLKLYASFVIDDCLDRYLVIDADSFFQKPTHFIKNNKCLYDVETEYHIPYFEHMNRLDKDLFRYDEKMSGICHHMIFEKKYLKKLMTHIENKHNDIFYNIFLKNVTDYQGSGASEYEIYFNYMMINHRNKIKIRKFKKKGVKRSDSSINCNYDYISKHHYL